MPTRGQLTDTVGHWLLDLHLGGRVLRFATAPVYVPTDAGPEVQYREGLADFDQGQSSEGSADFAVPQSLDVGDAWAEFSARFLIMERSRAVIRRWYEGQTLEEARVLIDGFVSGFGYGEPDEPVSFTVARLVWNHSRMMPTAGMVVDETTWPVRAGFETDEKILGSWYPMIFGRPGNIGGDIVPATEGLLVEWRNAPPNDRRLLIAGHRVAAAEVTVFDFSDEDEPASEVLPVVHEADAVGRVCALVDTSGGLTIEMGRVYYIGWNGAGLSQGIEALEGAGDLIEWILRTWTDVQIDAARFASVRDRLNAYRLSPYTMNSQVDPSEWLSAEVLKLLPVEPQQSVDGLWYRMRRLTATKADSKARLNADNGRIQRASDIVSESDSIVNEVTVEFAPDRSTNRYRRRVVVGPVDKGRPKDELQPGLDGIDSRFVGSYRAQVSFQQFRRQPLTIQAGACYDPATAVRIARDTVDAQALPRRAVQYTGEIELDAFTEGDVITLNDTSVGLIDVLAEVRDIVTGGPDVGLDLLLFDDPARLERLIG